jgi:hypothetical protein
MAMKIKSENIGGIWLAGGIKRYQRATSAAITSQKMAWHRHQRRRRRGGGNRRAAASTSGIGGVTAMAHFGSHRAL